MEFLRLLKESLHVLAAEPKVFIPRIATTLIYSVFIFMSAKLSFEVSFALALESTKFSPDLAGALQPYVKEMMYLFAASLVCFAADIIAYAMYPTIVADYKMGREIMLWKALREALSQWKTLLSFSVTILAFLAVFLMFFTLSYASIILSGRLFFLPVALVFMIAVFIVVSAAIFFIIPVSVIEKKGIWHSYKKSIKLSIAHRIAVVKTTVFFMAVTFATIMIAALSGFKGNAAVLAFIVFVLTRIIQVISYTYLNVVNPYLYLEIEEKP